MTEELEEEAEGGGEGRGGGGWGVGGGAGGGCTYRDNSVGVHGSSLEAEVRE